MKTTQKKASLSALIFLVFLFISGVFHSYATALNFEDEAISLTFDDGPNPRFTPAILDILKEYDAKATFFITGDNAKLHPDLVKRIIEEGHIIANHTMTHPHLEKLTILEVKKELSNWDETIIGILGYLPEQSFYVRPPRGNMSNAIVQASNALNKEIVLWDVCVENKKTTTVKQVRQRVMELLDQKNGGIVLAHDGILDRSLTVASFPLIMKEIEKRGYRIVLLDDYLKEMKNKES